MNRPVVVALAVLPFASPAFADAQFVRVSDLRGSAAGEETVPLDLSADGDVAVGQDPWWWQGGEPQAVRWIGCTPERLTGLPPDEPSIANAVSADGSVVVGTVEDGYIDRAFLWKEGVGPLLLPHPAGAAENASSEAFDVSADGSVIVGRVGECAAAWSGDGEILPLDMLDTYRCASHATHISGDGHVVYGHYDWRDLVVWRDGRLEYRESREASVGGVSDDGSFFVGSGPAIWSAQQTLLESLSPRSGTASATTPDGSAIVGVVTDLPEPYYRSVFLWDETQGLRELAPWLEAEHGLDLSEWHLEYANAISADGTTIAGMGINPMGVRAGWLVHLDGPRCPEPSRERHPHVTTLFSPHEAALRDLEFDHFVAHADGSFHLASAFPGVYYPVVAHLQSDGSFSVYDEFGLWESRIAGDGDGGVFAWSGQQISHLDAAGSITAIEASPFYEVPDLAVDAEGNPMTPRLVYRGGAFEPLFDWDLAAAAGFYPDEVALAPDGTIYLAAGRLGSRRYVVRANYEGPLDIVYDAEQTAHPDPVLPVRIELDGSGNLYLMDHSGSVLRIGADGSMTTLLDPTGDGRGHPIDPYTGKAFAVSDAGDVFVSADRDVFWVRPNGYVVHVLDSGQYPIDFIRDLAPGPDDSLYMLAHSGLFRLDLVPHCSDGYDNDGDGLTDHPDDPGCLAAGQWTEAPQCDNDLDDDGSGEVDWDGGAAGGAPDPECLDRPWRDREKRGCGLGFGASPALVGLALVVRRRRGGRGRTQA